MSRQGMPAEQLQGSDSTVEKSYKDRLSSFVYALEAKKKGDCSEYYKLLQEIDSIFKDVGQLRLFVQCVSYFDERAHEFLLMQLLGTSLWTCPNEVSDVILEFAVNLVGAQPTALHLSLEMLVRNFLPPSCGLPAFIGVSRRGEPVGLAALMKARDRRQEDLARRDDVLKRVFATLERISYLVPTAPTRLQSILIQKMPHRRSDKEFHNLYIKGVFTIAEEPAWASLRDHLLAAVIDRLIEIDVEIRWEDIVKQEEEMKNNKVYLFHMDLDDESDEEIEPAEQERMEASVPGSEAAQRHGILGLRGKPAPTLDEMADKMDEIMCMTLEHIRVRADRGEIQQVYKAVERSFLTTILVTHKSKFTQFLLFFLCSLAPASCGVAFANLLCGIAISPTRTMETRMSAAAYLASFLARSKFIPLSAIMDCLARLTSWCKEYANVEEERRKVRAIEGGSSSQEMIRASAFYAVCQAILYVICYRLHELLEDTESENAMRTLPLQWLFTAHLNPLAACLESVVQEFERQATASKLLDGKRLRGVSATKQVNSGMSFGGDNRLDMFFPFDPYLLRQSNRFIKPIYIRWQQPSYACRERESESDQGTDGEEENANEDSADRSALLESSDDEDETPERMAMSVGDVSHLWPSSAEDRGISPAPRSIGMGSYESDGFSDQARSCEPMSLTSPSNLLPRPSILPSKMPRKLSFAKRN